MAEIKRAFSWTVGRQLLGTSFLLALMVPLASPAFSVKSETIRTFVACMQTCNAVKDICDDNCVTGCETLFLEDPAGFQACEGECLTACAKSMRNCKAVCKFDKTAESTNLP